MGRCIRIPCCRKESTVTSHDAEGVAGVISRIVSFVTYGAMILGFGMVLVSCVLIALQLRFDFYAIEVQGKVLEAKRTEFSGVPHRSPGVRRHAGNSTGMSRNSRHGYRATIAYQVEGKEFTTTARYGLKEAPKFGDQVILAYLPGKVGKAKRLPTDRFRYLISSAGIPVGCLVLICARFLRSRYRQSVPSTLR